MLQLQNSLLSCHTLSHRISDPSPNTSFQAWHIFQWPQPQSALLFTFQGVGPLLQVYSRAKTQNRLRLINGTRCNRPMPFRDPRGPRTVKRVNRNSIYFGVLIVSASFVATHSYFHSVECRQATGMLLFFYTMLFSFRAPKPTPHGARIVSLRVVDAILVVFGMLSAVELLASITDGMLEWLTLYRCGTLY